MITINYVPVFKLSCILFLFLAACNSGNSYPEKNDPIDGEYFQGTSYAEINSHSGKIELSLCFATKSCIEPCYKGLLSKIAPHNFSGNIYDEIEGSESQSHAIRLEFSGRKLSVSLIDTTGGWLGISCDPEGTYEKK
jgi:hypothetical protein